MPHRIVKTETEFYAATDLAQPHTVRELSVMLGYNQSLVNNLQSEGFDVLYLDSMVRKGLHLDGSTPHMGGRGLKRINWRRNSVTSGLKPLGVNYDDARFLATEKQLVDTNLITYITSKKDVISFASNWADYASPGTALRNYLEEILVKK